MIPNEVKIKLPADIKNSLAKPRNPERGWLQHELRRLIRVGLEKEKETH